MKTRADFGRFLTDRRCKTAAEVGVLRGEFSSQIMSQWDGKLYLVDSWKNLRNYRDIANVSDDQHEQNMRDAIASTDGRATVIRGLSVDVAKTFDDGFFDCVYLDANHSFDAVMADLEAWFKKSSSIVAGHDYLDGELPEGSFGVRSAVLKFFGREPDIVTQEKWPTWVMFK